MKKPSDIFKIDEDKVNDLVSEMWQVKFAFMELGMGEKEAGELAYAAVELQELENIKNELENVL